MYMNRFMVIAENIKRNPKKLKIVGISLSFIAIIYGTKIGEKKLICYFFIRFFISFSLKRCRHCRYIDCQILSVRRSLSVSDCTKLSATDLSRHCVQRGGGLAQAGGTLSVIRTTNGQSPTKRY